MSIPLKDVVRFKERQWYVEDLEVSQDKTTSLGRELVWSHRPCTHLMQNAQDGDPNAMLRLAKMHLHGQGCEKSATVAQEWLRKARSVFS